MASVYDVQPTELIEKTANQLKAIEEIQPPEWASFVKTGVHKERPPVNPDWWYVRAAAVLRSIYLLGPIGVSKLRTKYGGKKNRGMKPDKFFKGSGNIIRKILQQLELAGLIKQADVSHHKGRVITPKGKSLLDKVSTELRGPASRKKAEKKEAKKEERGNAKAEKAVAEAESEESEPEAETGTE